MFPDSLRDVLDWCVDVVLPTATTPFHPEPVSNQRDSDASDALDHKSGDESDDESPRRKKKRIKNSKANDETENVSGLNCGS